MTTTLIACSHGTSDDAGRRAIQLLTSQVARLVPGIRVEQAFVDVEQPAVDDVVATAVRRGTAVVVPLLLSTGFHVKVDIARAVGRYPGRAVAADPLGPHPLITAVLEHRLASTGVRDGDAIVLAAAGSSDPAATVAVQEVARDLANKVGRHIDVGFAAGAGTPIEEAVAMARERSTGRVIVASYVLAPGFFAGRIASCGADIATEPLAPDVRVAGIVRSRFEASLATLNSAAA